MESEGSNELLRIVSRLEGAALEPDGWPRAIEAMGAWFDAEAGTIEVYEGAPAGLRFFEMDKLPEGADEYVSHYRFVCPRFAHLRTCRTGDVVYDYAHTAEPEMDRSEFYSDFLARYGLRYYVAGVLFLDGRRVGLTTFQRTRRRGHVEEVDVRRLRRLLPHVRNAVAVSQRLRAARREADDLRDAFDAVDHGVIGLDGEARVVFANARARILMNEGVLTLRDGVPNAADPSARRRLGSLLSSVLGTGEAVLDRAEIGLTHPVDGSRVGVTALRLPRGTPRAEPLARDGTRALLLLTTRRKAVDVGGAARLLGLTRTEAQVAVALASGRTVAEQAEQRGVSIATIRTHVAHIKEKLGVRSQVQLVAVVRDLVPALFEGSPPRRS